MQLWNNSRNKKILPPEKMPNTHKEKIYHIYAKDRCLFHSIKEEEFTTTWSTLNNLVGLMKTDYTADDLSYEELIVNKEVSTNSSH
jgi:uncharacterized protein YpmS